LLAVQLRPECARVVLSASSVGRRLHGNPLQPSQCVICHLAMPSIELTFAISEEGGKSEYQKKCKNEDERRAAECMQSVRTQQNS
jgi:hypothetical protein